MSKPPYIPRSVRGVELKTAPIPGAPKYQEIPQTRHEGTEARRHEGSDGGQQGDLEATRVPAGPHRGKTLIQLLNDHPGYLAHLRDDAFTDHEEFELKVDEFCAKYEHRLARATGGSATSILWAASIAAFRNSKSLQAGANIGVWVHDVILLQAADFAQAEMLAFAEAQKKFPAPQHQDHAGSVTNIPLADLRRALRAEQPGNPGCTSGAPKRRTP